MSLLSILQYEPPGDTSGGLMRDSSLPLAPMLSSPLETLLQNDTAILVSTPSPENALGNEGAQNTRKAQVISAMAQSDTSDAL